MDSAEKMKAHFMYGWFLGIRIGWVSMVFFSLSFYFGPCFHEISRLNFSMFAIPHFLVSNVIDNHLFYGYLMVGYIWCITEKLGGALL